MNLFNSSLGNNPYYLGVRISDESLQLAWQLIQFYEIQFGFGLAKYLGLPDYYDNHDAVRYWVHIQLTEKRHHYETHGDLRKAFSQQFPVLGYDWVRSETDMEVLA